MRALEKYRSRGVVSGETFVGDVEGRAAIIIAEFGTAIGRAREGARADETMIWALSKTSSGYAISKFKSEMEVWRGIEEGLEAVIVNPSIILGPGNWASFSQPHFLPNNE